MAGITPEFTARPKAVRWNELFAVLRAPTFEKDKDMNHKLDTDKQVFFYEQDFYVLSNFSAFTLIWNAKEKMRFDTSEMGANWTEICAYGTAAKITPKA